MSTTFLTSQEGRGRVGKGEIVDDFMYGTNVASSHIYIRMGFLRKVYVLLLVELLITTVVAASFAYVPVLRDTIRANPWLLIMSFFMSIGLLISLHVKRRHVPINIIIWVAFTVVEAMTVGFAVSMYKADVVVKAFVLTVVITSGLTAYTFQTKRDFTHMGAGLLIGLMVIISLCMMNIFFRSTGLELALAGGSAFIFCLFIVYDTQNMMRKLSPEEYILATIDIYLDIINLFWELLRLLGDRK